MPTVKPKAFIIAETAIDPLGLKAALEALGAPDWQTAASSDAEQLIEFAGKSCYLSFDTKLNKNLTKANSRDNETYIKEAIIRNKHGSVLEHATVTFLLADVSRVVTHELIRHRAGTAFSQVSGRYVRSDKIDFYVPSCLEPVSEEISAEFRRQEQFVKKLAREFDIENQSFERKKELTSALRRTIGNGQANHIVLTANHRALRHIIEMRSDAHAEEEIRLVAAAMFQQLKTRYPAIYADAIVTDVRGIPQIRFEHSKV